MILKNINKILIFFGLEIKETQTSSKHPKRTSLDDALKHLSIFGFYPKTIIDVGTLDGTFPLLNVFPRSKYIWIEPLIEFKKALKKLASKYNGQYIIAAAGKSPGRSTINVRSGLYDSSLYKEMNTKQVNGKPREVNVIVLDDLLETHDLPDDLLLKIDVQGSKLDVLEGAEKIIQRCEAIILEVRFFEFLKNTPQFSDIISYMKKKNFVAYDIVNGLNRPLNGALGEKDILFVKEKGRFRQDRRWASDEQIKSKSSDKLKLIQ